MKNKRTNYLLYLSYCGCLLSIIISVISLCSVRAKGAAIHSDDWIMGFYAFITTLLIGWQILSVVNLKELRNDVKTFRDKAEDVTGTNMRESLVIQMLLSISIAEYYLSRIDEDNFDISECYFNYIDETLNAIIYATSIDRYDSADKYAIDLINAMRKKSIYISNTKKEFLLNQLKKIDTPAKLGSYFQLYETIKSIESEL